MPVVILLALMALVAVVTGCHYADRPDSRLVVADSLMADSPDSALAIVEGICRDSLAAEGDLAYRDLLLTQARYRCYITATSDSDINRALDYYRRHDDEREKLTRAYIYKGAVMEELGQPDSAMYYYKSAEATAAPDDYFNLGYCNMRMGALYRDYFYMDGKDLEKYEKALKNLLQTDEKHYQLVCMINLGLLNRLVDKEKSESMLLQAKALALEMNDTTNYLLSNVDLVILYDHYNMLQQARDVIRHIMSFPLDRIGSLGFTSSANVYAELEMPDSAEYFLKLSASSLARNEVENLSRLHCIAEIARARGDSLKYLQYAHQCKELSDSLQSSQDLSIMAAESNADQRLASERDRMHRKTSFAILALCVFLFIVSSALYYRHMHRYDIIAQQLRLESENQSLNIDELAQNVNDLKIKDEQLNEFITSHLQLFGDVIESSYHLPRNALSDKIIHIVKFQSDNMEKWDKLCDYVDMKFGNIITLTRQCHPHLKSRELLLLALTCLDYSCAQIAVICGYSNATSVSGYRQRLARKMGLKTTLKDYIQSFSNENKRD